MKKALSRSCRTTNLHPSVSGVDCIHLFPASVCFFFVHSRHHYQPRAGDLNLTPYAKIFSFLFFFFSSHADRFLPAPAALPMFLSLMTFVCLRSQWMEITKSGRCCQERGCCPPPHPTPPPKLSLCFQSC